MVWSFVYSCNEIFSERVEFDKDYYNKLQAFSVLYIVPELKTRKCENSLMAEETMEVDV